MYFYLIIFLVVFISIYGVINFYIGYRFWQALGEHFPFINKKVYRVVLVLLVLSYIIGRVGKKYLPEAVSSGFTLVGAYWMAVMMYLLITVIIFDLIRALDHWLRFLPATFKSSTFVAYLAVGILFVVFSGLVYGTFNAKSIKTTAYTMKVDKSAGSVKQLRIAVISDLHLGDIIDRNRLNHMVKKINEIQPDMVLIPGDIIDDDLTPFIKQNMGDLFKTLKTKYGIYASLGNHDYYGGALDKEMEVFKEAGLKVLRDEAVKVDDSFYIVGREDSSYQRTKQIKRKPLIEIMAGIDTSLPVILLDHQPNALLEAQEAGVDLQVSGHTHKGQLIPGNLFTKKIFEVDYGFVKKGKYHLIVSSGIGTWGPPVRIGTMSEIVDVTINFR